MLPSIDIVDEYFLNKLKLNFIHFKIDLGLKLFNERHITESCRVKIDLFSAVILDAATVRKTLQSLYLQYKK